MEMNRMTPLTPVQARHHPCAGLYCAEAYASKRYDAESLFESQLRHFFLSFKVSICSATKCSADSRSPLSNLQ